jgi:hypothetical protein
MKTEASENMAGILNFGQMISSHPVDARKLAQTSRKQGNYYM